MFSSISFSQCLHLKITMVEIPKPENLHWYNVCVQFYVILSYLDSDNHQCKQDTECFITTKFSLTLYSHPSLPLPIYHSYPRQPLICSPSV